MDGGRQKEKTPHVPPAITLLPLPFNFSKLLPVTPFLSSLYFSWSFWAAVRNHLKLEVQLINNRNLFLTVLGPEEIPGEGPLPGS
jgi:hypothetical protein